MKFLIEQTSYESNRNLKEIINLQGKLKFWIEMENCLSNWIMEWISKSATL